MIQKIDIYKKQIKELISFEKTEMITFFLDDQNYINLYPKNYNNYNHKSFLNELKQILEIKSLTEYNKNLSLNILEEIIGDYIFVKDNFIKMILILFYIKNNFPVILM